jgi:hypothetical protein
MNDLETFALDMIRMVALSDNMLTATQAARVLGISPSTLRNHKEVVAVRTSGGHRRYRVLDVLAALEKQG